MSRYTEYAAAKVNLFLHVTGKRNDGYHTLYSHVVFCPDIADSLVYETQTTNGKNFEFTISGPYADGVPDDERNLVLKALTRFSEKFDIPLSGHLHLEKNLPVGAGIGGGSADAAAALRLFSRIHNIQDNAALHEIALSLGADVPMCLQQRPAIVSGIGDDITNLNGVPRAHIVLVNPNKEVLTKDVFQGLAQNFNAQAKEPDNFKSPSEYFNWLAVHRNDLSDAAEKLCHDIKDIKSALARQKNVLHSGMSGSGGTCFALFKDEKSARKATRHLRKHHPGWWIEKGKIG